ncbi:hypothetical protein PHMEG_00024888 [Phytophthora megakarya]|uniref:Eukaryotic/viral aspartic protease n=1 Tax=Phytophthora megakarya TaxID=4795 RepID=A0A225VCZ9_9STRA|nr:hypothetical protein PHMEG_00024888 [Phytophthora megakarya]
MIKKDAITELAWQIRELTAMEEMDPTSKFEIAQHRPLGKITPFHGRLDESENSMQWLRGFVYEMKGTHTPPNEWCMAFQLSLRDGAVHWHRDLSRKTKRTWSLLSDKFISYYCSQLSQSASTRYYRAKRSEKKHIHDYLNRLNGYARSANIRPDEYSNDYSNDDPIDIYEGDEAAQDECDSDCGSRDEMQAEDTYSDQDKRPQAHDFGKCEGFDELAKILRTNVDKKNISPELQKLVFVNDMRTSIPLATGANVSIITTKLARPLRLDPIQEHGRQLEVQRIQEGKMSTTTRVKAKVTLGWNTIYEFEFWIMDHSAGSEVVLGTDFMIPAGIRLDLFNATAKLPGEEMAPLVKSLSADEDSPKRKPSLGTHDVCVRRTAALIPTITRFRKGQPTLVRLKNITGRVVYCPAHLNVIAWVRRGFMPKQAGYVPIDSRKYKQWQVLAYAGSHDETWFKLECELILQKLDEYSSGGDDSLSQDKQWSMEPVARSVDSATDGSPVGDDPVSAAAALGASSPTPTESVDVNQESNNSPTETQSEEKSLDAAVADLEYTFMCFMHAQELAFLPDLTEPTVTELDYTAPNVKNSSFIGGQQRRLDEVLKRHDAIMILSGNALPPPAYGIIDIQGHAPKQQRARRIPLRHLQKLYELLKGLLKAGFSAFSDSLWLTAIMGYAMPLVDDLLTELENYLWFCSLDAASGFWAIMMMMRARKTSAFVCPLGHLEWLRMPFGLKNAPMIYQRMIDNALWGFVILTVDGSDMLNE